VADVHVFGIRHHGPGSARSLVAALKALDPEAILIEGPPDADDIIPLAAREGMKPPVAILVYAADTPQKAVFYPFAAYSPEWQAIRFALERNRPIRFIDLPQVHRLAAEPDEHAAEPDDSAPKAETVFEGDPLSHLARLAGYADGERWWDHLVETRRTDGEPIFAAVHDAIAVLREGHTPPTLELQREAHMRHTIRSAAKEYSRIAVVCGAWHAPALSDLKAFKGDMEHLKGLPKTKTKAAWVPWSYDRLAFQSGYGAGVESPEWYHLLWKHPEQPVTHWMTKMARLMRKRDLPASSAHVIEAVRLADALATLRGLALPGLNELLEAAQSVVCQGESAALQVIERELVFGHRLGHVPEDLPLAPLQEDLAREQKRLRMPVEAVGKDYDLDLRKPNDLERSQLLHRLNLLSIPWGTERHATSRSKGTFRELWNVQWKPEFAVALIDAALWGGTVAEASAACAVDLALKAGRIEAIAAILNRALLSDLGSAVEKILVILNDRAAVSRDILQLMDAFPELARARRYGSVRQTDGTLLDYILGELATRIYVGLGPACASLDDAAAAQMTERIAAVDGAMGLREDPQELQAWRSAVNALSTQATLHALVAGKTVRMLHDARAIEVPETATRMAFALSPANGALAAAQWIEGFVSGSGTMLVHDDALWTLLDDWVSALTPETFTEILPLLRRTFSTFQFGERRQLGERARAGRSLATAASVAGFNPERAARVLPLLRQIFVQGETA
jgi:uncharacterized protein DUF5682